MVRIDNKLSFTHYNSKLASFLLEFICLYLYLVVVLIQTRSSISNILYMYNGVQKSEAALNTGKLNIQYFEYLILNILQY